MDEVGPSAVTAGRVEALAVSEVGTFAAITTPSTVISTKGSAEFGAASLVIATTTGVMESPRAEAGQSVAISPDARWVAEVAADGAVSLVDCTTRKEPITLPVADAVAVEFDDTGRYLLVSGDGRVDVFDGHAKVVSRQDVVCACFIRQEQPLLCVSDTAGRSVVLALPAGHERCRWSLSFVPSRLRSCGPAGDILAVNGSMIITIDPGTGEEKSRMNHLDPVREITPSPSGAYLLSETTTGRSTVWDVASSLQVFEIDEDHARAVWISGDRLALVRGNRFDIEPASSDELIAEASSRGGELSRKEWQTYLPDERWPGESRQPPGSVGSPDVQPDDDDTRAKRFD
jgi:WD40 repeat protein